MEKQQVRAKLDIINAALALASLRHRGIWQSFQLKHQHDYER